MKNILIMKMLSLHKFNRIELLDDIIQNIKTKNDLFINGKIKKAKTIDVLNNLVEINNDRIEGYKTASKETEDPDLISLFTQFIQTTEKCKHELSGEIFKLGDIPTEETKKSGKISHTWMDIKLRVTGNDRISLLNSCKYGKEHALETYEEVLTDDLEYLSEEQTTMVSSQFALIRADHLRLQSILNAQKV